MIKSFLALFSGMRIVFKHLFKKPVTLEYPEKTPNISASHRGMHVLNGCIGCGVCQRVCPANAITLKKVDKKVASYQVDLNKCIFCGQCQYYCPVSAIKLTEKFELATAQKENLIHELVDETGGNN